MAKITFLDSFVIGIITAASCPKSLGSIDSWRWWVYIILVNILLQSVWGTIKGWRQRRRDKKFKESLD